MSVSTLRQLAGHHLTEAIHHLSVAAARVRDLAVIEDSDEAEQLALCVEGAVETMRDAHRAVEAQDPKVEPRPSDTNLTPPAPLPQIKGRTPKKPDRRGGDRRASRRRLDDNRAAALRTKKKGST